MWADDLDELLAMADRIGAGRSTLKTSKWDHFDISRRQTNLAVKFGAVLTDQYGAIEYRARLQIASEDPDVRNRGYKFLHRLNVRRSGKWSSALKLKRLRETKEARVKDFVVEHKHRRRVRTFDMRG
jgi:hypothetical protein